MKTMTSLVVLAALALAAAPNKPSKPLSTLDAYIEQATAGAPSAAATAQPGAIWSPVASLSDLARDLKASQVNDVVTILVSERASAVATGVTKSARASAASNSVGALAGVATPALANLARLAGSSSLNGEGTTSRETTLTTTLSARVTHVLPGGLLVVEGTKTVQVNSEQQVVVVRGLVRSLDLSPGNLVPSDRIANLEVRINGKGVVGDAVRRPFFLYRLILGLLPF